VKNALGVTPRDLNDTDVGTIRGELDQGKIDLLLIHVAEGAPGDLESATEFRALKGIGLLGPKIAIIHGVALGADQFTEMATAGTALVWSPRSNFELYGFTADVIAAKEKNVKIALAPDWSPTGSTNSLAELKYASAFSHDKLSDLFSAGTLFRMSTSIPAQIAHVDDKVGTITKGLFADLFVLAGTGSDPYAALAAANPQDIQLVLVGGVPIYGSASLMNAFSVETEALPVCDATMYLNSATLPAKPFRAVLTRLSAYMKPYGIKDIGPIAECPK
jgi:5-methylthioadenosine/S-adenosylhomocysteine deaminase